MVCVSKKTTTAKADRSKGIEILSDVALSEATQLKEAIKKSKKDFHISQASGSGDGTDLELGVPDEQQCKTSGTVEGTDDNDDDIKDDNDDNNDDVSKGDDDKADSDDDDGSDAHDSERTDLGDDDENPSFTLKDYEEEHDEEYESNDDNENVFEEEDDDDLYKDVDVRSLGTEHEKERKGDEEMTDADQNVSQEQPYEQVVEDAHVTLTASQKTDDSKQSSYVSLDFANQFIILEKAPPSDHEVASLMNIKMSHKVPSTQIPSPLTKPATVIPDSSTIASTTSYTQDFEKKAQEKRKLYIDVVEKSVKDIIKDEVKSLLPQILPKEVSDFTTPVIQSTITESLENVVLAKSSTSLIEFELKKTVLDKLEKSKSYRAVEDHKNLYDALVKSYQLDNDLFDSYGKAYSLKRSCEDKEKDEDPPAGPDQGLKKKNTSKDAEPSRGSKSKESKSSSSKGSNSQSKSSGKSAQEEELVFEIADTKMPQDQGDDMAFNLLKGTCKSFVELEYHFEECYKAVTDQLDWNKPEGHKYPFDLSKPLPLIEVQGRQVVPADYFFNNNLEYLKGRSSSRKYTTSTTKTKAAKYDNIEGIEDMVPALWSPVKVAYDKFAMWSISHWGPKQQKFYGYASNKESKHDVFSRKRIIVVTHVKVMKWYGYGYLEEIIILREDQTLHKFKEGDFPRLNLRDIEDLMLLLV
ncbi:hypothetical protein Tco_0881667 [Tanacetum coccineum]